jgi:hypothetical protein
MSTICSKPPVCDAKGKVVKLGYVVRTAPLPEGRRQAYRDCLLEMASDARARRGVRAPLEPEIGCPS